MHGRLTHFAENWQKTYHLDYYLTYLKPAIHTIGSGFIFLNMVPSSKVEYLSGCTFTADKIFAGKDNVKITATYILHFPSQFSATPQKLFDLTIHGIDI